MSVKVIIKIVLALVFISILLWLIFGEDTTLNGNEDGEGSVWGPYGTGTYLRNGIPYYTGIDLNQFP
jgi:hypothetical protein